MPTPHDAYRPERWVGAAVFFPESRAAYRRLLDQPWTDALRVTHAAEAINAYWDYFRNAYDRNAGLRMDHLLLSPARAATRGRRRRPARARLGKVQRSRPDLG